MFEWEVKAMKKAEQVLLMLLPLVPCLSLGIHDGLLKDSVGTSLIVSLSVALTGLSCVLHCPQSDWGRKTFPCCRTHLIRHSNSPPDFAARLSTCLSVSAVLLATQSLSQTAHTPVTESASQSVSRGGVCVKNVGESFEKRKN
eukprot:Selendium_serpulae@DN6207_c0_g1_i1.p1